VLNGGVREMHLRIGTVAVTDVRSCGNEENEWGLGLRDGETPRVVAAAVVWLAAN